MSEETQPTQPIQSPSSQAQQSPQSPEPQTPQSRAIQKSEGPCIILAGAGTGKTYTIVQKILHLINSKIYKPERIVCLTFSNEAANSLSERVIKHIDSDHTPIIKTFHSFSAELLKKHGSKINLPENFHILLPDDAKILLHKNFKLAPYLCNKYISEIGIAKDLGISPEELDQYLKQKSPEPIESQEKKLELLTFQFQTLYLNKDKKQKSEIKSQIDKLEKEIKTKKFLQTWKAYEKLKSLKAYQDYSDLNQNALKLLEKHPDLAEEYDYIIVDEFQDTNKLQCDILEKLAPHKRITVVGDLNQSIYRFRGAYRNNLDQFKNFFNVNETDTFALDKSYRSTNKILSIAHKLIENNYTNKSECFQVYNAQNKTGQNVQAIELKNGNEEVRKIIEIIKSQLNSGTPQNEICIMFRTHQQSTPLKRQLEYENIPYTAVTKKSLLKTPQIKVTVDILTILNKLKNKSKSGEQAWWDLIFNSEFSKPDSIVISKYIKENKASNDPVLSIKLLNNLDKLPLSEEGRIKAHLILNQIKTLLPNTEKPLPELILKIYETLALNSPDNPNFKEQTLILQKFHSLAQEHYEIEQSTLSDFTHHLEIINTLGIEIEAPEINKSGIRIMTNHATKGLEYDTVIISNLAQKRFPMEKFNNSLIPSELSPELKEILSSVTDEQEKASIVQKHEHENQLSEERRLCYVAFTRAKNNLFLTHAQQYGNKKFLPSQFLNEIEYKKNSNIDFKQDLEEKYQKPSLEIKPAQIPQSDQDPKIVFSPSALQTFDQCQKRYEYKYIYNMPDPVPTSWEAIKLGSFTHEVFDQGVKQNFKTEKEFVDLAKTLQMRDDWNFIELKDAIPIIKVFYERNKNKYSPTSLTETRLSTTLEGLKFVGYADRIDLSDSGELEIIDYKTGSTPITPKYRNWQLGFYALASSTLGTPKRLTLDMLKKEKPLEFALDENGNATEIHSGRMSFSLQEVKQELVDTAKQILEAHKSGFKPCPPEKNCPFCEEWVYKT